MGGREQYSVPNITLLFIRNKKTTLSTEKGTSSKERIYSQRFFKLQDILRNSKMSCDSQVSERILELFLWLVMKFTLYAACVDCKS